MKKTYFLLILALLGTLTMAQNLEWAKQMGGTGDDYGNAIVVDASGNVYTTGYFNGTVDFNPGAGTYNLTSAGSTDIFISKLDASGNFVWAKQFGGTNGDNASSIAIDASGNVYTTGTFFGTVDFDPGAGVYNLTASVSNNVFISKLNSSGNFVWAKQLVSTSPDCANSIYVDGSGNVYTTGYFAGTVDFDPGAGTYNLTAASGNNIFISKLDATGSFVWAKQMVGASSSAGCSVKADVSGNVYTTGYFNGTVDFNPGAGTYNLTSAGSSDIFISKLNSAGNFVWADQIGGATGDYGNSIDVDGSGNVYTTGYFSGTVDFNPGAGTYNLTTAGSNNIFISKLNSSGSFVWAKQMVGASSSNSYSIKLDALKNVYTSGNFYGTVDFDPGAGIYNLASAGSVDVFMSKLDSAGNFAWARRMGGTSGDEGLSIDVDASGNVYTTGYFQGTADFDPGTGTFNLTSAGLSDIFVAKYFQHAVILSQSTDTTICKGSNVTFHVTAGGSPPYNYQWKKNGTNIGTNSSTYNISSATVSDEGIYICIVSNPYGSDTTNGITLKVIDLHVNAGPDITFCNDTATHLLAVATTNHITESGSLIYSWTPTTNLGSPNLASTTAQPLNNTTYIISVNDQVGCNVKDTINVISKTPVSITANPLAQYKFIGGNVTFSITASGTPTITYHWKKNGAYITGATSNTYTINGLTVLDNGIYSCVVKNFCDSIESLGAKLTVIPFNGTMQHYSVLQLDTIILNATGYHGNIQWQQSIDSTTWSNITGAIYNSYKTVAGVVPGGVKYYQAKITDPLCPNATPVYSSLIRCVVYPDMSYAKIGDNIHGGIVFYADGVGNGLISAQQDQSNSVSWGCYGTSIPGAVSTTNGASNTSAIVAGCLTNPIAASIADTLTLNSFTDWYLPAKDQLDSLYHKKSLVGAFTSNNYWSSSQNTAFLAYSISFSSGSLITDNKNNGNHIRCIRSYTSTENVTYTTANAIVANQPVTITITGQTADQAKCLGSNATFSITTTGTTAITYLWKKDGTPITGATSNTYTIYGINLLDEGIYTCEATNLCRTDTSNNAELKVINITADAGSDATICHGQNAQLQATGSTNHIAESGTLHYSWNPSTGLSNSGIANPVANPVINTTYTVTVTDSLGCTGIDSVHIVVGNVFQNEQICIVTVDTTINENKIIWEKTPNVGTDTFFVYKKDFSGLYNIIGKVPYDSMSVFIDTSSAPDIHSDSYKISAIDTCLNESALCSLHKTMLLSVTQGAQLGRHNLNWENYQGFTFNYYRIFRGLSPNGLSLLDSVLIGTTLYNDTVTILADVYYLVEIVKPDTCYATSSSKNQTQNFNTTISNMKEYSIIGIAEAQPDLFDLNAFPNPFENSISISYKLQKKTKVNIEIYNVVQEKVAEIVNTTQAPGNYKIEFLNGENKLANGVYYIRALFNDSNVIKKVIKL